MRLFEFAQDMAEASGYDGSEPLDLSKNPSVNDVFKRALYIYDYEGYSNDMDYSEDDAIDQYVAQKFGDVVLDQLNNARHQSYFGREGGNKGGHIRSSNLGTAGAPVGKFRTTKAGKMHSQDVKMMKNKVADRLGRHPAPSLPESEITESDSPVASAITRRILLQRSDLLSKYGPEKVMAAIDDVADFVGDTEEIGSSDVSGWIKQVEQSLASMTGEGVAEGKGPLGQGDLSLALKSLAGGWSGWHKEEDMSTPEVDHYEYDDGEGNYYGKGTIEHNWKTGEIKVEYHDSESDVDVDDTFHSIGDAMKAIRGQWGQTHGGKAPNFDRLGQRKQHGPDDLRKTDRTGRKGSLAGGPTNQLKQNIQWSKGKHGPMGKLPEAGPYGSRNPDTMSPNNYDRYQQDQMDQGKRDFKRQEHDAEWEQEKAHSANLSARDAGTWYIRLNGKLIRDKQGNPYSFRGKAAANKAALTMQAKLFNQGKEFMLTTNPNDKQQGME